LGGSLKSNLVDLYKTFVRASLEEMSEREAGIPQFFEAKKYLFGFFTQTPSTYADGINKKIFKLRLNRFVTIFATFDKNRTHFLRCGSPRSAARQQLASSPYSGRKNM
jgi:hypothetical protein